MNETRGEGEEPQQGKKERYTRNNLNVDEASQRLGTARPVIMQVLSNNACNNLFDGQHSPGGKEQGSH